MLYFRHERVGCGRRRTEDLTGQQPRQRCAPQSVGILRGLDVQSKTLRRSSEQSDADALRSVQAKRYAK